ncbi:hypothetical protein EYZ11_004340 [Aspergillus tanneri]|uniref:Uncharacterized protein n=1 Tax=Aspergillus tanneri TaxID=1220188 RepID=A0A4S3JN58_9EURO|nr:hypothetical protein EYZ11_004340 [Aspergillus tanneri]
MNPPNPNRPIGRALSNSIEMVAFRSGVSETIVTNQVEFESEVVNLIIEHKNAGDGFQPRFLRDQILAFTISLPEVRDRLDHLESQDRRADRAVLDSVGISYYLGFPVVATGYLSGLLR